MRSPTACRARERSPPPTGTDVRGARGNGKVDKWCLATPFRRRCSTLGPGTLSLVLRPHGAVGTRDRRLLGEMDPGLAPATSHTPRPPSPPLLFARTSAHSASRPTTA